MDAFLSVINSINDATAGASEAVGNLAGSIWDIFCIFLVAAGLAITFLTRGVQFRSIKEMFRAVGEPSGTEADGRKGISSFRAFTVSAASRVGTGNIAGVAIAITMGGPGAVFWMWVIAGIGAASAFAESLLGQLYKQKGRDSYIGGPAYYMKHGLRAHWMGVLFALLIIVTYAFVFVAVQTNAVVEAAANSFSVDVADGEGMGFRLILGLVIMLVAAAIIFGGVRAISSVTEILVPVMAVLYLVLGLLVVVLNLGDVPHVIAMIFEGALGIREFAVGGIMGAITWGMRRGVLSNEAGIGTAPNAGATATISHPAKQGFVQALGVYFDTWLVCSITAFIVLLSDPAYGDRDKGASLTQDALALQLGDWAVHFLTVAIILFAFSSVIGNYYYGESNMRFMTENKVALTVYRVLVLVFIIFGSITSLSLVWNLADILNAAMVVLNLGAVGLLMPKVMKVLKNYEVQCKAGLEPIFKATDMPEIKNLAAWDGTDEVCSRDFWEKVSREKAAKKIK
ncbi:alanine/glycine:cation symporter family protein [Rothia aerolata]|uniref:Na+/alanine symporter n=1 Tax=Rothia aerolata TaxID=1812262 RepID=A0A917MW08_9MICC|nr:alanine/glycine:cation symporter family protein [Rothia aerolata]GGH67038.1 Na+/alanine symporter [Rothia aerolata]